MKFSRWPIIPILFSIATILAFVAVCNTPDDRPRPGPTAISPLPSPTNTTQPGPTTLLPTPTSTPTTQPTSTPRTIPATSVATVVPSPTPTDWIYPPDIRGGLWHVVRGGDSLWHIALSYYGRGNGPLYQVICEENKLPDCCVLVIGQRLYIPEIDFTVYPDDGR